MSPQLISHLALHEPTSSQLISVTSSSSKTTCPLFIYLGTLHAHPVLLHHVNTSDLSSHFFLPDFPQKLQVEDVKTKLSCETSLKKTES
jgi:hypothetical protein